MGVFDLDYSHLRAAVEPDRIPLRGNEHRIMRVAFDLFRLDNDKENLWQVQADDDGNEFLVRTYDLPKDELQATSEWNVIEDGKKASLTVSYRGLPIHRLVASDFGAYTSDDVRLLRDLVQVKLSDSEFASKMLDSLPEQKRATLLFAFPKLAAQLPKIPPVSGKDPLEGIEPYQLEEDIKLKPKYDLLPAENWKTQPQMAEDKNFQKDLRNPKIFAEAKILVPKILAFLKKHSDKEISLDTLYMELECNDIPLYLALHALVKSGHIQGESPYNEPSPEFLALTGKHEKSHKDYVYSIK